MNIPNLLVGGAVGMTVLLSGCSLAPTTPTPEQPANTTEATPAMTGSPSAMDMSKLTGVAMLDGKMLDIWEGNELMMMEGELMLGDAKVGMDGKVTMKDGNIKILGDGEMMMKDGNVKRMDTQMVIDAKRKLMSPQDDGMMKTDDPKMMKGQSGTYQDYAPSKLAMAKTGKVVLFFKASWCPSCRSLDANITSELSSIPEGVQILKVDYDNSTELKAKYGITSQHTLVQIDADGKQLKKWSGSGSLSTLLSEVI